MPEAKPPAYLVDTSRSPHALLRPVPLGAVRLTDSFWEPRRRRNREVTLPSQYRKCEETGSGFGGIAPAVCGRVAGGPASGLHGQSVEIADLVKSGFGGEQIDVNHRLM